MANATITVLEADGVTSTDVVVLDVGRQAAAASKSVAASTEDKAVLDAIAASLALLDNSIASGNELQVDVVGALPAGTNAIGKLAANSGVDIGDVDVATINGVAPAFGGGAVGATVQRTVLATDSPGAAIQYVDVTLSLHTNAGVALDLLADAQIVATCTPANDVESVLQSVVVIDEDENAAQIRLIFLDASTSLGTEGDAIAMTDAMCRTVLGTVDIATTDYMDFGGAKVANKNNVGIVCKPASGTDDIYVAAQLVAGTPTYTASGIRLRLGFM